MALHDYIYKKTLFIEDDYVRVKLDIELNPIRYNYSFIYDIYVKEYMPPELLSRIANLLNKKFLKDPTYMFEVVSHTSVIKLNLCINVAELNGIESHMILLGRALDDIMADLLKKHLELVEEFNKFNLVHF